MAKIQVQKLVEAPQTKLSPRQLADKACARVSFYFPYTLAQARRLPAKDVRLLITTAEREKYLAYYYLTQIVTAPHTEKGKGVTKLLNYFSKRFE